MFIIIFQLLELVFTSDQAVFYENLLKDSKSTDDLLTINTGSDKQTSNVSSLNSTSDTLHKSTLISGLDNKIKKEILLLEEEKKKEKKMIILTFIMALSVIVIFGSLLSLFPMECQFLWIPTILSTCIILIFMRISLSNFLECSRKLRRIHFKFSA